MEQQRLANKTAIVTGAASGIGRAIAERFAREGARVALADINAAAGEAVAEDLRREGGAALAIETDVSSAASVEAMVMGVVERFGPIDILVNSAAVEFFELDGRTHELSEEIWDRTHAINLKGVWLCSKYAIPHMLGRGGAIVHIASPTGLYGVAPGQTAYSSSKAGVAGLTRVMAAEYGAERIRVNAIVPGTTDTPLIAGFIRDPQTRARLEAQSLLQRLGRPEEVAALAVFLASDEAAYCTGGFYMVDGGLTAV